MELQSQLQKVDRSRRSLLRTKEKLVQDSPTVDLRQKQFYLANAAIELRQKLSQYENLIEECFDANNQLSEEVRRSNEELEEDMADHWELVSEMERVICDMKTESMMAKFQLEEGSRAVSPLTRRRRESNANSPTLLQFADVNSVNGDSTPASQQNGNHADQMASTVAQSEALHSQGAVVPSTVTVAHLGVGTLSSVTAAPRAPTVISVPGVPGWTQGAHSGFGYFPPPGPSLTQSSIPVTQVPAQSGYGYLPPQTQPQAGQTVNPMHSIGTLNPMHSIGQRSVRQDVKLPKLSLTQFSGDRTKFRAFMSSFRYGVAEKAEYSKATKLAYLLSALKGNPLTLVESFEITDENYDKAMGILVDAYGDPAVAIEDLEGHLFRLESPGNDSAHLRNFYCKVENILGGLESLGGDAVGHHLVSQILGKLPRAVVSSLEHAKPRDVRWTVALMRTMLRNEVEVREATDRRCGKYRPQKEDRLETKIPPESGSADVLLATDRKNDLRKAGTSGNSQVSEDKKLRACRYCGLEGHYHEDCSKFKTVQDRRNQLGYLRLCFICLGARHNARNCMSQRSCFHCQKMDHHRSICPQKFGTAKNREQAGVCDDDEDNECESKDEPSDSATLADDEQTVLKTAMVEVGQAKGCRFLPVRAFLDSGCSRSFITESLAKRLNLKSHGQRTLNVTRFGGDEESCPVRIKTANLSMRSKYGKIFDITVAVTPTIMSQLTRVAVSREALQSVPPDINLADELPIKTRRVDIDFLVGNDYYDDFVTGSRIDLMQGLRLVSSEFGWILSGRVADDSGGLSTANASAAMHVQVLSPKDPSDQLFVESTEDSQDIFKANRLEDLWSLETIGIRDNPNPPSDDTAIEQFNKTVRFENGRYMVTWPFKANVEELPSNYDIALHRLERTVNRIKRTSGLVERYDDVIKDQLSKSVIEKAPEQPSGRVHYLPHREVLTPQKETTKLRIVYDASARSAHGKPSLNDCLYRGQVFMTSLLTLVMRFMLSPVVVISDIEKAFLQVGLQEQERDVTRFLWLKDISKPASPGNLIVYRFARVAFGMKPSPFLLGATIAYHLLCSVLQIAKMILENIYIDNVITGFTSETKAIHFYAESKKLFQDAGMNLREFVSNSTNVMNRIPERDRAGKRVTKVLGIGWDSENDKMFLNIPEAFPAAITVKELMQGLLKVYDPLGIVTPITIRSRVLLQKTGKRKAKSLRERIPQSEIDEYNKIIEDFDKVRIIKWPRYMGHTLDSQCRLMCFCDASQSAYAIVVYLQHRESDKMWSSRIIFSKARVSPLKSQLTIPRLELMAVVIGVRAIEFIRAELGFSDRVILWTDSACVLSWIDSNKVRGTFVENRLREIHKCPGIEYRFVRTKENPADLPSRGANFEQLTDFWWKGPEWASLDDSLWPNESYAADDNSLDGKLEAATPANSVGLPGVEVQNSPFDLKIEDFSSFNRLIRVTAWCLRWLEVTRKKSGATGKHLFIGELRNAENMWIRYGQAIAYPGLHQAILTGKRHPIINQLGTVVDIQGIIRCRGRFARSSKDEGWASPILIPTGKFGELLVEMMHKTCLHAGKKGTLSAVRTRYWIVRGPFLAQKVVSRCVVCRRVSGTGFARPSMPSLPHYRVTEQTPFEYTGLDYMGPMSVKGNGNPTKVWVCLLTCLTTRAMHLELVGGLSANDFLMALRRFVSRRGKPVIILCDNASQFQAVSKNDLLSASIQGEPINWKFITPLSPWKGGVYERLIGLVKSALKKSIGRSLLSKDQLTTLLSEVEYTLNSRPISPLSTEPGEKLALTPNDLLGVKNLGDRHNEADSGERSYGQSADSLEDLYRRTRNILHQFWILWKTEYLAELRSRQRMQHKDRKGSVARQPKVGEVVILQDESLPRCQWKLAIVTEVIKSPDGESRSVVVKLPNGSTFTRSVTFVHPLEITQEIQDKVNQRQVFESKVDEKKPEKRTDLPKRQAAVEAKAKIKALVDVDAD